jgi:rhodanese-related sulfurtransferase
VRGALNVPADGRFAETAGTVVEPHQDLLVLAPQDREEEVVARLARIGFDKVTGYLREPEGAFLEMVDELDRSSRVTVTELRGLLGGEKPPLVLDVRNAGERESGAIEGSLHIPLAELPRRITEVAGDRPVVTYCAGGYRSSVAASLLRRMHGGDSPTSSACGGARAARGLTDPRGGARDAVPGATRPTAAALAFRTSARQPEQVLAVGRSSPAPQ